MNTQLKPTTSPAARLQQKPVISEIPPEIFLEIFSYFGPAEEYESSVGDIQPDMTTSRNSAIHNMALVCRDFYHHLFPLLFENVYTHGSDATTDEAGGHSHCARFCGSIVEDDEQARRLATYTKRFAIVSLKVGKKYQTAQPDTKIEQSLSTFSKALSHMVNLQELYLFHTSIMNDLLQSAVCLPSLNVLRLEYCGVPKKLDAGLLAKFSNLHVARVFVEHEITYGDAIPYENFTRHLCMSRAERFISDVCVEGHVLRGLAASSSPMQYLQILHLETVHIDRAHPELISSVLSVMPVLKSLHIAEIHYRGGHWDLNEELAYQFKPCSSYPALPHLVHIHAPLYAVQALVPDSNASSVGFSREYLDSSTGADIEYASDDEFWHHCAFFLDKSKYYISRLDIPTAFYWGVHFATHFPELRRLTLRTGHCNWHDTSFWCAPEPMIKSFLEMWDTHPRLDELEFIYEVNLASNSPTRISLSTDMMSLLRQMMPTLRVLKFSYAGSNSEQYVDMSGLVSD